MYAQVEDLPAPAIPEAATAVADERKPLIEVATKVKAIGGMEKQLNDMERRIGIMKEIDPVLLYIIN